MATLPKPNLHAEYVTAGYIRNQHRKLFVTRDEDLFKNVPEGICLLCALYFSPNDYFEIVSENKVKLSNGMTTATKISKYRHGEGETTFGSILISSTSKCICEWDINIDNLKHGHTILVGIASSPFDPNEYCHDTYTNKTFDPEHHHAYVYGSSGQNRSWQGDWNKKGNRFTQGDMVSIYLDLKTKELRFYVNGIYSDVTFDVATGEDISYRLAIVLIYKGCQVTLSQFQQW